VNTPKLMGTMISTALGPASDTMAVARNSLDEVAFWLGQVQITHDRDIQPAA
jgi:hypothetical protein